MGWIPIVAWIAAALIALVVLGYCGYEIAWKAKRLRADVGGLQSLTGELDQLRGELADTRARLATTGLL